MGVPAFFRWLTRKYPSVIVECVENKQIDEETGRCYYEDCQLPNPNGIEFDNLYLDMNGIIHPCTHPENKPAPKNEDEMMVAIFECIDRLFAIIRPRKLLYMAIDGVAPRAKMNQQRSRRFRAAKESTEKSLEIQRIRTELLLKGCVLPPEKTSEGHFDSNCITPGTPFMARLSQCLNYYIVDRMNNNPAWKGIQVILSDANVPGEGEHKIMDFIRKQRSQPDYNPNTQHVLCGADADLIMLGLATHEPHFTIIREEFLPNKPRPCEICNQFGHEMDKCTGLTHSSSSHDNSTSVAVGNEVKYIFVRLNVLREYLKKTLEMPNLPFKYDFERVVDDWVFMCFFVGNDFLPHLPSLEIREGAIDRLVELYKKCVYKTGGYLTNSGEVSLERVQLILTDLGQVEDQIFKDRQRKEKQFKASQKAKRMRSEYQAVTMERSTLFTPTALGMPSSTVKQAFNYKEEAIRLRVGTKTVESNKLKRKSTEAHLDSDEEEVNDEVRLWEDGFKDRYYESKFDVGADNIGFRYSVALQYVRGLCWVLKYYYQGCASWDWYFPYHYAPFASDFINITGLSTTFKRNTKPFNPLEQLMSVFPAASKTHIPESWRDLMTDPSSPIIDFYPEDFKIDLNGKKFAWQGVALLPFVDEKRLFSALKTYYCKLTPDEVQRNTEGDHRLYIGSVHKKYKFFKLQYTSSIANDARIPIANDDLKGTILTTETNTKMDGCLKSPVSGLHDIENNKVITVLFKDPTYPDNFVFPASRLSNAIDPPKVLAPEVRSNGYRPVIGFNNALPQAYLGRGGHRMVNAGIGNRPNQYMQQPQQHHHQQHASNNQDRFQQRYRPYNNSYHQRDQSNQYYNNNNSNNNNMPMRNRGQRYNGNNGNRFRRNNAQF